MMVGCIRKILENIRKKEKIGNERKGEGRTSDTVRPVRIKSQKSRHNTYVKSNKWETDIRKKSGKSGNGKDTKRTY